ncbi:MAG: tripartite tricarboxylate transporter permease, partial [Candidatus Nanoarchaeia archaeon]|nr:tripartite tricarboxylate transporter permease [Candidatus Nanoarchaeia archaeon]
GEVLLKDSFSRFLTSGRMNSAVKIIAYSSIMTYSIIMILGMLIGKTISSITYFMGNKAWIFLLILCASIIWGQKNKRMLALTFFLSSGALGFFSFNLGLNEPFLPLLTGMFGLSGIIMNSKKNIAPSQMENSAVESGFFEILKQSIMGTFCSIIMMLLPAISPSQIGFFASKYEDDELKVASITSINIADVILSLVTFFFIGKGRSGTIEKIGQAMSIGIKEYYLLMSFGFFALLLANFFAIHANKKLGKNSGIIGSNYFKLGIMVFVILLTFYFDGALGLIVLFLSTIMGLLLLKKNVRPVNLMGCLAVPTLIFFASRFF